MVILFTPLFMSKNFCFTSFSEDEPKYDKEVLAHIIYKRELCPKTNRLHWQGACQFHVGSRRTYKSICKLLGADHVERCKGTYEQNIDYVSKEETKVGPVTQHGDWTSQGKRNDLTSIPGYKYLRDIPCDLYIKYSRGIKEYRSIHGEKRDWKTEVWILWGKPGSGKSKLMPKTAYWKAHNKWWDGYDGEEEIVFDDWNDKIFTREEMLRICDRYPLILEVKGSCINFLAKYIYITSNTNPLEWYNGDEAWKRRICFVGQLD